MLLFSETLVMVSDTGEPQGELTIDVQRGKYKDEFGIMSYCPFVHASSRGYVDGVLCGTSLLGRAPADPYPPPPPFLHCSPLPPTSTQDHTIDFALGPE